ncbi:hypothetical protein [Gemmata sp.]|uniref:hypothetical protein n=1 Tax=Gemmata sp. TaxID=1914242 RepID=UPI003F6F1F4F
MFWLTKVLAPAALVAAVGATVVVAQPPERRGGDDKKGGAERKGRDEKRDPMSERPAPRPDATVDAWVKVLVEKIADPHDTVRDSARAALVHVGPQAVPALKKLADGDDTVKAVAARNVIAMIERGPQPGRPGRGDPMGPGGERPGQAGERPGGDRPGPGGPMGPGGPGGGPGGMGRALGELNLTEKQEKQAREIIAAHGKKVMEFGEKLRDGAVDREAAREGFEKLRGELMKELKGVLDAEQVKKLEAAMSGPGGFGGPGGRPGGPPPGGGRRPRPDSD